MQIVAVVNGQSANTAYSPFGVANAGDATLNAATDAASSASTVNSFTRARVGRSLRLRNMGNPTFCRLGVAYHCDRASRLTPRDPAFPSYREIDDLENRCFYFAKSCEPVPFARLGRVGASREAIRPGDAKRKLPGPARLRGSRKPLLLATASSYCLSAA